MIVLISIIYAVCVWIVFAKLKWAKPRPVPIAVAAVIAVVLIGGIVIVWRFTAPLSTQMVVARYTIQLVPQVNGPIAKIHAKDLVPVKKDEDILFEIDPGPYASAVEQFAAQLAASRNTTLQFEAARQAAVANVAVAEANLLTYKAALDVAKETEKLNPDAIGQLKVIQVTQEYEAARATVDQVRASVEQAQYALDSSQNAAENIQAKLSSAQSDLDACVVRAPSDGFVVNWVAREGTMTASLPLAAVGTFVDTSEVIVAAVFGENVLRFVKPGDKAEIALEGRPGEVFTGSVAAIVNASGEGQFVASGTIPSVADVKSNGMLAVKIELDDPELCAELPMGAGGAVAIYTEKGKPFHVMSKISIRMQAWQYFLLAK